VLKVIESFFRASTFSGAEDDRNVDGITRLGKLLKQTL